MAEAKGHKFGQIIGEFIELSIGPILAAFAKQHGLYLDQKGKRKARTKKWVTWEDHYGNSHNLDYVLERGGSDEEKGTPVAFIESAWRRYTKHSKNKAQEIQGAVLPIREKHQYSAPFIGCIFAGDYTSDTLKQLQSLGFKTLYFPYTLVLNAFQSVGFDVNWGEKTPDKEIEKKLNKWKALHPKEFNQVWSKLLELNRPEVETFMSHLERAVKRIITSVRITPLHGSSKDYKTLNEAIKFINSYDEATTNGKLVKYEIIIKYDNGDKIEAQFQDKATTVEFLQAFQGGNWAKV